MESISLDAIDLQLLDLLQRDAGQSNQQLAEQVHVSPPTCLRRVRRLHEDGNDVARRDCADDAAHGECLGWKTMERW